MRRYRRSGFTFIELLITVVIIGILANIAIPATHAAKKQATVAAALADVLVIRTALMDYYADTQSLPPSGSWGAVPREIVNSLPNGFLFTTPAAMYRWQRNGKSLQKTTGSLGVVRIQIVGRDRALATSIRNLYSGRATGNSQTLSLIIE